MRKLERYSYKKYIIINDMFVIMVLLDFYEESVAVNTVATLSFNFWTSDTVAVSYNPIKILCIFSKCSILIVQFSVIF